MKKQDLLIPMVMLALGAGIGFWTRDRQQPQPADTTATASERARLGEAPVGDATSPAPSPPQAPPSTPVDPTADAPPPTSAPHSAAIAVALPPMDVPVRKTIDALRARALAGDAVAACRLAADLAFCSWSVAQRNPGSIDGIDPARAQSEAELAAQDRQLSVAQAGVRQRRHCEGLTAADLSAGGTWLRQAARAGHVPSILAYARTGGVPIAELAIRSAEIDLQRNETMPMLESAARTGSVGAVFLLGNWHDQPSQELALGSIFAQRRDPSTALSYQMLHALALELPHAPQGPTAQSRVAELRAHAMARGELSLFEIDAAENLARQRFQDWFAGEQAPDRTWDLIPIMLASPGSRPLNQVCIDGPWTTPPVLPARSSE